MEPVSELVVSGVLSVDIDVAMANGLGGNEHLIQSHSAINIRLFALLLQHPSPFFSVHLLCLVRRWLSFRDKTSWSNALALKNQFQVRDGAKYNQEVHQATTIHEGKDRELFQVGGTSIIPERTSRRYWIVPL